MADEPAPLTETIRAVLENFSHIQFAFLFGSAVTGRLRRDSDLDIAVYGDSGNALEIESDRVLEGETEMQLALERATDRNVDLLVLNRAPALVCAAAVQTGSAVLIRNESLYSRYVLAVADVAIDFLEAERSWRAIRARSSSLSPIDRNRLERIIAYVHEELEDESLFRHVTARQYQTDRSFRRNLDRWVETLINAVLDIAKIVLASEKVPVPQTYGQILELLPTVNGFSHLPDSMGRLAALRNVMAHEYLDLRFTRVRSFLDNDVETVRAVTAAVAAWLAGSS